MPPKKRDRLEIIFDILDIIRNHRNSIKQTPLLRKSNLSSKNFNEYYQELIHKKMIKELNDKKNKKLITLTDKGFLFLEKYKYIKNIILEFEL